MTYHSVVVCCWKYGHETNMTMTLRQEEALVQKIAKFKAVCPTCRDSNEGNQSIFIKNGRTVINSCKVYRCSIGHITAISAFMNGMLHLRRDKDFTNVEGTIDELPELIDTMDISCQHDKGEGQLCDCKLEPIDDSVLTYPTGTNIKTKTRVGDLWDRAGIEPVRPGHYDNQGEYQETKSEALNRHRLQRIRDRNIPADRHPGTRIDKPTDTTYKRRPKNQVKPERLTGPK